MGEYIPAALGACMKRLIGYTAVLCLLAITVGCGGVTNTGTLAYISNSSGTGFTVLNVNTDGTLTRASISPQNTPAAPKVLQFSANGKWAYFLDAAGSTIYAYTRAGNGQLTTNIACGSTGATNCGGFNPGGAASSMVLAPNNNFLYVALPNTKNGELVVFSIDTATGYLNQVGTTLVGYPITQLVMAPGGTSLFGLSPSKQAIVGFTLNTSSGAVTQNSAPTAVGVDPAYMILSANGSYMYVPDFTETSSFTTQGFTGLSPKIYGFNVAGSATLQIMTGSPFNENAAMSYTNGILTATFPSNPITGVTSNDSRYLFVANQGSHNISVFKISTTTGEPVEVLGALTSTNVSTASPFDCGYETGCTTPTFTAVSTSNNALYVIDTNANKIFQIAINQNTGRLRALQTAEVSAEGSPTWMTIR